MSCATVALNDWPGWLILEPRLSPRRTVITVPGGIVTEVRTGACAVLDCPGDPLVPELLPDIAPALFPLFAEVSEEGLSPEFAWLLALEGWAGWLQATRIQAKKTPSVRLITRDRILYLHKRRFARKTPPPAIGWDSCRSLVFIRCGGFNRHGALRWFRARWGRFDRRGRASCRRFSSGGFGFEKPGAVQERPAEGRVISCPSFLGIGIALKAHPHAFHLRIQVVKIMEHQGLGKHRQFWRSEFVLPMMADDQMLHQSLEFAGEVRQLLQFRLQHFELDNHVPQQLTACGVGKRAIVGQLVDLAYDVEEGPGEQQVAINLGVIAANQVTGPEQRNDVIEEAANVGVMQALGCGSRTIRLRNLGVAHERLDQRL